MSAWSALASAALLFILTFVAAGQPAWEWKVESPTEIDTWSYGLFDARHTVHNLTTDNVTTDLPYPYSALQNQPNVASVFQEFAVWFVLALMLGAGGAVLGTLTALRRLRGLYAGVALVGCCAVLFVATVGLIFSVPEAAGQDLYSRPLTNFSGQIVTSQGTIISWGPAFGWFIPLGMTLVAAWGASEVWGIQVKRHRRSPADAALAGALQASFAPSSAVPTAPRAASGPDLEEVFLISSSGLLIKHLSRSLMTDKDRDVVGGMISVVSNFVREAFSERDGEVQEVTLGSHRFVLCSDEGLVIAVLARRGNTREITHRLQYLLSRLIERYAERISEWDGKPLEGIEDELAILWETVPIPPAAAP